MAESLEPDSDWGLQPDIPASPLPSGSEDFAPWNGTTDPLAARAPHYRAVPSQPSCSTKALNGLWAGVKFGLFAGAVGTAFQVMEWGLRGPAALAVVVRGSASAAFTFGSGIGLYRGSECTFQQLRGVQDVYNAMLAGGLIGALAEAPVMLRNRLLEDVEKGKVVFRPRPRFLFNTAVGAAGCGILYLLEASPKSTRQSLPRTAPFPPPLQEQRSGDTLSTGGGWAEKRDEWSFDGDATVPEMIDLAVEPAFDKEGVATS